MNRGPEHTLGTVLDYSQDDTRFPALLTSSCFLTFPALSLVPAASPIPHTQPRRCVGRSCGR